ncbi:Smr/MutS family protein [Pseudodesulfovibrio sp. zrk46]|uniref:Smr/MutS family protein n=1 Tax=Pseudodesulfovibrio sp. zrk46 TaxID=2725288 RepID=UPI00144A08FF|nr:Smr/MutS family protein [Pseudodesulfovibrio sp. zrk46]QJB57770.1 DNA mismatch repair protein MutS [Pseudodesulfovibrio sp. zrk46]
MGKKKRIKNLGDLKSLSFNKKEKKKDAYTLPYEKKASHKLEEDRAQPDDEEIFMAAMHGVKNISGSGRQVSPKAKTAPAPLTIDPEERAKKDLQRFLRGDVEFELEYTDEYMYGYVRGLDIKTFQQLKAGALSVASHLDLHGMTSEQAHESLLFFIRESYMQGHRCVLVVTGRGVNSPGGQSILRRETESWLTRDPLKRAVLAFCTAQPKDGGAGAIYVLLRKQKKAEGKIIWDKMHTWEEV